MTGEDSIYAAPTFAPHGRHSSTISSINIHNLTFSAFYIALRRAQATLDGDESQLIDWLTFFIRCLVRQKEVLERKIERERQMPPLAPLSEKLLRIVSEHGRVTVREAAVLTGASRNTIKVHLKRLVDGGRLTRRGRSRGTWYERA